MEHLDLFRGGRTLCGRVHYETAKVTFTLTTARIFAKTRSFEVNGETFDFSKDFETLHEDSYNAILEGNGFTMEDARQGVRACETIRRQLK